MKLNLHTQTDSQLKTLYKKAKSAYYETDSPILSDADFDKLEDYLKEKFPKWEGFKTGAEVKNKKTKERLPIPMGSLDKVKPEGIDRWLKTVPTDDVVVTDKLDGLSLEIVYEGGKPTLALTRGNGLIGGNVSYLIPHMRIPQKVGTANFIVRCEVLFSSLGFKKYAKEFDHPRNAASGLLNTQKIHPGVKDLSVVVLDVLKPRDSLPKALDWAKSKGFTTVPYLIVPKSRLNGASLTSLLTKRKANAKYSLDGLVLTYNRRNVLPSSGNPTYSVAFKFSSDDSAQGITTTVTDVIWSVSHLGTLTPRVKFEPVMWDGAKLTYATAFNAKFVNQKKIGPGALISVIRSGEIIPIVNKVLKPAVKVTLPDPAVFGAYKVSGVNYVLVSPKENATYRIKKMLKFFATMKVDFIKIGTVTKLFNAGFVNLNKILKASPAKLVESGLTPATAKKLHSAIQKVFDEPLPLTKLMAASATFPRGMGERRFTQIGQELDILSLEALSSEHIVSRVSSIPGFGTNNATTFAKGLANFFKWQKLLGIPFVNDTGKGATKVKALGGPLKGQLLSWTSYRSKDEEAQAVSQGALVVPYGSKTTILLYSPTGKASSKVAGAKAKGIPVMTWPELVKKFKLS